MMNNLIREIIHLNWWEVKEQKMGEILNKTVEVYVLYQWMGVLMGSRIVESSTILRKQQISLSLQAPQKMSRVLAPDRYDQNRHFILLKMEIKKDWWHDIGKSMHSAAQVVLLQLFTNNDTPRMGINGSRTRLTRDDWVGIFLEQKLT